MEQSWKYTGMILQVSMPFLMLLNKMDWKADRSTLASNFWSVSRASSTFSKSSISLGIPSSRGQKTKGRWVSFASVLFTKALRACWANDREENRLKSWHRFFWLFLEPWWTSWEIVGRKPSLGPRMIDPRGLPRDKRPSVDGLRPPYTLVFCPVPNPPLYPPFAICHFAHFQQQIDPQLLYGVRYEILTYRVCYEILTDFLVTRIYRKVLRERIYTQVYIWTS